MGGGWCQRPGRCTHSATARAWSTVGAASNLRLRRCSTLHSCTLQLLSPLPMRTAVEPPPQISALILHPHSQATDGTAVGNVEAGGEACTVRITTSEPRIGGAVISICIPAQLSPPRASSSPQPLTTDATLPWTLPPAHVPCQAPGSAGAKATSAQLHHATGDNLDCLLLGVVALSSSPATGGAAVLGVPASGAASASSGAVISQARITHHDIPSLVITPQPPLPSRLSLFH